MGGAEACVGPITFWIPLSFVRGNYYKYFCNLSHFSFRNGWQHHSYLYFTPGMKISDISVDIYLIYLISMMFNTISVITDILPIYQFWTDIS